MRWPPISPRSWPWMPSGSAVFSEEAAGRLTDACWFEAEGDVDQGISNRARYADLVILGQYERQGSPETHPLPIAHSVVSRCGRPVLVVPAAVQLSALERIAIAWDGSREAVRSVHDACRYCAWRGLFKS